MQLLSIEASICQLWKITYRTWEILLFKIHYYNNYYLSLCRKSQRNRKFHSLMIVKESIQGLLHVQYRQFSGLFWVLLIELDHPIFHYFLNTFTTKKLLLIFFSGNYTAILIKPYLTRLATTISFNSDITKQRNLFITITIAATFCISPSRFQVTTEEHKRQLKWP